MPLADGALQAMLSRLWSLFRRDRLERELDHELTHHLELLEAEYQARGLSPDAARAAARRDFGNVEVARDACRDQKGIPMLETIARDVRVSLRSLWRNPVVASAVIITLAIGIGATTTIFSVVNGVLIRPLPYPDSDRLIEISYAAPGLNLDDLDSSPYLYFTAREQSQMLDGIALWQTRPASVTGRGEPEQVLGLVATSSLLPVLGIQPLLGRHLSEADDRPGSARAVVLTHGYWQRRFGGDPSIVGQPLTIEGEAWTVIGVMPQRFTFRGLPLDVILPYRLDRSQVFVGGYYWRSIARVRPGVPLERLDADMRRLIPVAMDSFPLRPGTTRQQLQNSRLTPSLSPLKDEIVGDAGGTLWVLMGSIGLVLLIACANVANLLLVRTEARQQELTIRAALGAGRRRIAGTLLVESAVLSAIGGLLGVAAAYGGLQALFAIGPTNVPRLEEVTVDSTVLLFAAAVSLLSGVLFGLAPVIRYARPTLATALRTGGRGSDSRERLQVRGLLVVVQVALALVLLVSAGLMIRTFEQLNNVDPGFANAQELQTLRLDVPLRAARAPEAVARRQQDVLERILTVPGVTSAAFAGSLPMEGRSDGRDLLLPEGKVFSEGDRPQLASFKFMSPGLFDTLGTPLAAGRDLTWTDVYEKRPVVLISEALARREWGSASAALGKRVRGSSDLDQWREIVGVVNDIRETGLNEPHGELVYFPVFVERIFTFPVRVQRSVAYIVRSGRTGTPGFLPELQAAVTAAMPGVPISNIRTMSDVLRDSLARTSFTLLMLAIAGGMALLLGIIGIYGVIAYTVSQRVREVGIRMALGARRSQVRAMFVRQGLLLTGCGVAVGLVSASALSRWMSSLLFEVSPLDPATYSAVAVVLVMVAVVASYIPSRRATRIDAIQALRAD